MNGRRILVVDDDHTRAGDTGRWLEGLGYRVERMGLVQMQDATTAIRTPPDLILLDVPEGGGSVFGPLESLRTRWRAPVIFLVLRAEDSPGLDGVDPSMALVKPWSPRELHLAVELSLARHDAAGAVRETEERFFAASLDLLCLLDFDGYFKRLSPSWERTLGFTLEELMSRPFIEFVHPDDRDRTLAQNAHVRTGGQARAFENRYLCKDGSYRWFHWNAAPDTTAHIIYSVARDVTEKKKAEADRELLVHELKRALAEVSTLREILPICSYCRKVRDDEDYWHTVEAYISRHTATRFSHGICPGCMAARVEPELRGLTGG